MICVEKNFICNIFHNLKIVSSGNVNGLEIHVGQRNFIKIRLQCYISVVYEISTFLWFWQKLNGLSNKYWGWGLEDDEFYQRMKQGGIKLLRPENVTETANCFR